MEWMLMPLRRYAEFTGRSRRKEYWMYVLLQILVMVPLVALGFLAGGINESGEPSGIGLLFFGLVGLLGLALIIPTLAVQVRRLHDTDRSGWWVLIGIIPVVNYIGSIVLLVFYCLDGTKGENRFGADPKADENVGDVFN